MKLEIDTSTRTLKCGEVTYSFEFLEMFGSSILLPPGVSFKILKREDGMITLQAIHPEGTL